MEVTCFTRELDWLILMSPGAKLQYCTLVHVWVFVSVTLAFCFDMTQ